MRPTVTPAAFYEMSFRQCKCWSLGRVRLCDPTDCSPWSSSVCGILQARILETAAFPFSRGSSQSRDWTLVSGIASWYHTIWATKEAKLLKGTVNVILMLRSPRVSNPVLVTQQCSEYLWKLASLSQNTEIFHFISAPWHPPNKSIFIRHTFFSGFHHEVFNSWVSTGKPCGSKQSGNHDIICWTLLCMLSPALGKSVSRISRWCQGVPHLPFSFCRTECMHRQLLKPND